MAKPEGERREKPYKLPKDYVGITLQAEFSSVTDYLSARKFALIEDLIDEGFTPEDIEQSVNEHGVRVARVFRHRETDFFWTEDVEKELDELAKVAYEQCGGDGSNPISPSFGDIQSVGKALGSRRKALAGLVYGAHKGLVVESDMDNFLSEVGGPIFWSKDGSLMKDPAMRK